MKRSFTIYAIIVLVLTNLYTYMYFSKKEGFETKQQSSKISKLKDSIDSMNMKMADANYFSLEQNENAINYLETSSSNKIILHEKLIPFVTEALMDLNVNPKGNPYVGYDTMGEHKFIINKAKLINHRWIIADFSNGDIWGEVLLKYFINADETIDFEVIQSVIYPKQKQ